LLVCVQGVITAPRVRQRSQRDVHGVRLRAHNADVLVHDISVSTRCGEIPADIFVRVSSISEAAMPATAEQPAKKQKLAFELPAINSDFDTFLKVQLEASPAEGRGH